MERFYEIAGIGLCVEAPDQQLFSEDGLLAPFRRDKTEPGHRIHLKLVERLSPPEGRQVFSADCRQVYQLPNGSIRYEGVLKDRWETAYMRIARRAGQSTVEIIKHENHSIITPVAVLEAMELEHQLIRNGGFLLHAAYVEWRGEAILFTAPSGTGKTTQAALWCRLRRAQLINGDRAAVMVRPQRVEACGVPYSGLSSVSRDRTLPLKAIVQLSQAKATRIERLSGREAVRSLMEGSCISTWDPEDMRLSMETVMQAASRVPVYHLACTPDASAVTALEEALKE